MCGEIFSMVLKKPVNFFKKTANNRVLDHFGETSKSIPVPEAGIRPVTLPREKDLTKPGRRVKSQEKKIAGRENFTSAEGQ